MEFSVWWRVHPYGRVNHRVLASVLIEWSQYPDVPTRTRLDLIHDEPVNESFQLRVVFKVLPDTFAIHSSRFLFAKIRSFIDRSKFFYTFLAYSPFVFTKNLTNRKLMGALMAYIGHGAHTLSTPTQRNKLSNSVWMPQFIR